MNWNVSDIKKYEMLRKFVIQFINSSQMFTSNMSSVGDPDNLPLDEDSLEEIIINFLDVFLDIVYIFKII